MKSNRLRIENLNDNGIINLLEGFVELIRDDFFRLYNQLRDNPRDKRSKENYDAICNLIVSDYFGQLTGLNGKEVLKELELQSMKNYRRFA